MKNYRLTLTLDEMFELERLLGQAKYICEYDATEAKQANNETMHAMYERMAYHADALQRKVSTKLGI